MAIRHRKSTKRSAAAKRAWATRRRHVAAPRKARRHVTRKATVRRVSRKMASARAAYARWTKHYAPRKGKKRALYLGHKRVLRAKGWGKRSVRKYVAKYRLNPRRGGGLMGGLKNVVMSALPVALGFGVSYAITNKLSTVPAVANVLGKLGKHARPALALALTLGAHFALGKVKKGALAKAHIPVTVGAALNFLHSVYSTYLSTTLGQYLGAGEYVEVPMLPAGEYVETPVGDYYQDTGAYEETGAFEELGGVKQMQLAPAYRQMGPAETDENSFYTGVFSGGFGS